MRVIFDGSLLRLDRAGQTGAGGLTYFEGVPWQRGFGHGSINQRGAGFGNVLRTLWRYLKPIASTISPIAANVGKELGKEGLATTARVLNKIVEGGDVKESIVGESKEGVRNLLTKATGKLQKGAGRKRKKNSRQKSGIILKPNDIIGTTVPQKALIKKKRSDTLGYY